jgi:hypothetical protein
MDVQLWAYHDPFPLMGPIVESKGVAMYLESPGFYEENILHIVHLDSPDFIEYIIPESVATSILGNSEFRSLSSAMIDEIDYYRRDLHTPRLLPWCTSSSRYYDTQEIFLRNEANHENTKRVGLPVIRWNPLGSASRWNLQLIGSDTVLAYAAWDDADGIIRLAEQLKDPDSLLITMALVDPKVARLLTSKMETDNLFELKLIPEMSSDPILEKLREHDLLSLDFVTIPSRGEFCTVRVALGDLEDPRIPVAIGVRAPSKSSLTETLDSIDFTIHSEGNFDESHSLERFNAAQAELDRKAVLAWRSTYRSLLAKEGWHEVGIAIPSDRKGEVLTDWIWMTKIALDRWGSVALAASDDMVHAAHTLDIRSPKRECF